MSERTVVSETPAVASKKVPGVQIGDVVDYIHQIVYSDGVIQFRCTFCQKEFPTFGSCAAHHTHHGRTSESYKHGGNTGRKKSVPSVANTVNSILRNAIGDISLDIAEAIAGDSDNEIARLNERIAFLQEQWAYEKALRKQAEKDLTKIKNLFK